MKASQKQEKFTQLYSDVLFKIMFGTERNKMFAQDFLESYLNLEQGSLKGLKILNSFSLDKETIMSRKFELDIKVELPDGSLIDIEMQRKYDEAAETRLFLYLTGLAYTQLKTGEEAKDFKSTRSIILTEKMLIHKNKGPYLKYIMTNVNDPNDKILENLFKLEIIHVEGNCEYFKNIRFKKWLKIIRHKREEELKQLCKNDEIFKLFIKERERVMSLVYVPDLEFQERAFELERNIREREIERIGENRGERRGKLKSKTEVARNMLKLNMDKETISKVTGLNKKQIEKLKI